jgi:hypothetical protein
MRAGDGGDEAWERWLSRKESAATLLAAWPDISLVINIYFSILPNQQRARSDFCLILYVVNYGCVGKCIMRKSKRYAHPKRMCSACWRDCRLLLQIHRA